MNSIKVLTPDIYNKIAAGEVVENPAAAVKELIENSIDAGASRISVDIKNGGLSYIAVTDNGSGISEDDIDIAFLKHSTSKVSIADDLFDIETLGFRGEALASIAAVSRVKLTSRTPFTDTAVSVDVEEGKVCNKSYKSANVGTTIEISDLFYNTPGRKKFLKSESRENAEINKYISHLILTEPYLEIKYTADGQTVYRSGGGGVEEAIYCIYGADCLKNCLPISGRFRNVTVKGYIGSPDYSKANGTYQTLSVNGRYVTDKNIGAAVSQAFRPYLMTRKYPFFVLSAELPYDEVDVNVHPKKTEVRFADGHKLFTAFYVSLKEALSEYAKRKIDGILQKDSGLQLRGKVDETVPFEIKENYYKNFDAFSVGQEVMTKAQSETVRLGEQTTFEEQKRGKFENLLSELDRELTVENARKQLDSDFSEVKQVLPSFGQPAKEFCGNVDIFEDGGDFTDDSDLLTRIKILGAAFRTYLILELDEKLILIDQHAAHERILFDKFLSEGKIADRQPLMIPYVFTVKDDENEFIENNLASIENAGFELQPFGKNTYRITAVSVLFVDTKLDKFVDYILSSISEIKLNDAVLITEKIAQKACKAAVKAGYALSDTEISYIVETVCENKTLQCPHGRPITVVLTKTQLEKMFKRIV